jgi:hypothetical protein
MRVGIRMQPQMQRQIGRGPERDPDVAISCESIAKPVARCIPAIGHGEG